MRRVLIASVLVLCAAASAAAQSKPDFSGTWQLDRARSTGGGGTASAGAGGGGATASGGGGGGGGTMTAGGGAPPVIQIAIKQTAAALTIDRQTSAGGITTIYKFDGSDSVNTSGLVTTHTKSHWSGGQLVTEGTQDAGEIHGRLKETRWLDKDGSLVVESERQREGTPAPITSRQVYTKAK